MRLARMRVWDLNAALGTIAIPVSETAEWGQAAQLLDYVLACIHPAMHQATLLSPILVSDERGTEGQTATVYDIAVLVFTSGGPFPLRVTLLGPGDIFLEDDVTVDMSNADVEELVAYLLEWGVDSSGSALTACVGGRRSG